MQVVATCTIGHRYMAKEEIVTRITRDRLGRTLRTGIERTVNPKLCPKCNAPAKGWERVSHTER